MADYHKEFSDFGELDVELPDGHEDVSWSNEACPCFYFAEASLFLYVDFVEVARRECTSMRRFVAFAALKSGYIAADELLLETDDFDEVLRLIASRK